jgi:cobalt-precorrin-6B (C15)-methyltransferase
MTIYKPGIPDSEFQRGKVPMTKREIRVLTLAGAAIQPDDAVLDVGAGTGSLTVEAAFQAERGQVFAVEYDAEALRLLRQNAEKFSRGNVIILPGRAPETMPEQNIPLDVVLLGGSGGRLADILAAADRRLKLGGRLVINIVTLETLSLALRLFEEIYGAKYCYDIIAAQITRMKKAGDYHLFDALNPVYILSARKTGE